MKLILRRVLKPATALPEARKIGCFTFDKCRDKERCRHPKTCLGIADTMEKHGYVWEEGSDSGFGSEGEYIDYVPGGWVPR